MWNRCSIVSRDSVEISGSNGPTKVRGQNGHKSDSIARFSTENNTGIKTWTTEMILTHTVIRNISFWMEIDQLSNKTNTSFQMGNCNGMNIYWSSADIDSNIQSAIEYKVELSADCTESNWVPMCRLKCIASTFLENQFSLRSFICTLDVWVIRNLGYFYLHSESIFCQLLHVLLNN